MKLTNRQINNIFFEFERFKEDMYAGKSQKEREELAQFFTPPEISIKLLELYDVDSLVGKVIRDPCSGSGNLLAAALIAGADADKILGNDYDATMVDLCRKRIKTIPDRLEQYDKAFADELRVKLQMFNDWQIHQGNALHEFALAYFDADYYNFYKPNEQLTGGNKNTDRRKNIDKEDYDPYTSKDFQEKHLDIYNEVMLARNQKQKQEIISQGFTGLDWLLGGQ